MSAGIHEHSRINGVDKVARYKWSMRDTPGVLMSIHKSKLHVDSTYQRSLNQAKTRAIASKWSWIGFGVLTVAERDGTYWIVDGQHRHAASLMRSDVSELPCIVFSTMGASGEANGFLVSNTLRKAVTISATHKAKIVAGDEQAIAIQSILDELGIEIATGGSAARKRITCLGSCYKVAGSGLDVLRVVLSLSKDICCNDNMVIHQRIIQGLWYIHTHSDDGITDPRMEKRIRQIGGAKLLDGANSAAAYYATGGERIWASGILKEINKGLQKKFVVSTISE